MKTLPSNRTAARYLIASLFSIGLLHAAVGEVTPLNKADMAKVEAVLVKAFKGKPTVESGKKEELDNGWKITCTASVGSGGEFDLVVMTEKTMTLGYVDSQIPKKAAPAEAAKKS